METKEGYGMRFDEISERLFANMQILQNALRQQIKQVAVYDKNTYLLFCNLSLHIPCLL
jgi:hypothetical protein